MTEITGASIFDSNVLLISSISVTSGGTRLMTISVIAPSRLKCLDIPLTSYFVPKKSVLSTLDNINTKSEIAMAFNESNVTPGEVSMII